MLNFALQKQTEIEAEPATVKESLQVGIEPHPRSCPACARQLSTSGAYHFWCADGHYDGHEVIPANERMNYCKYCHDPLRNGACEACRNQASSTNAETAKSSTVTA